MVGLLCSHKDGILLTDRAPTPGVEVDRSMTTQIAETSETPSNRASSVAPTTPEPASPCVTDSSMSQEVPSMTHSVATATDLSAPATPLNARPRAVRGVQIPTRRVSDLQTAPYYLVTQTHRPAPPGCITYPPYGGTGTDEAVVASPEDTQPSPGQDRHDHGPAPDPEEFETQEGGSESPV